MSSPSYFGKYRGVVTDVNDPLMTGRIRATVPDVLGDQQSGWALPCAPFGGTGVGFFSLPTVGAGVWIEFEHGNPDYPIWAGCWWGTVAEVPPMLLAPPYKKLMIVTEGGQTVTLDDTPGIGGITLETSSGQKLVLSATGVEIDNGMGAKITMQGPQVSVNSGALDVI
ncbi:MAG: phage baseplate assembly protein V [Bacteroidota bacterium]